MIRCRRLAWLAALAAAACADSAPEGPPPVIVAVDGGAPVAETSERFLSFTVDTSRLVSAFGFERPRLRRMVAELAPAVLRLGGTQADTLYYDLSDVPVEVPPAPYAKILTRAQWDAACDFASALGLEILFTLNVGRGPRDAAGAWTPDNARALVEYTRTRDCPVTVWELGNEVGAFLIEFGFSLAPSRYASDFALAREMIGAADPAARLAGPASAYWPVAGELPPFLPEFLTAGGPLVDIVTWHYYPTQSDKCPVTTRRAEPETLLDPANLDEVSLWAEEVESLARDHAPRAEVWLDESGHAQCGGQEGVSDRFVAGFWWLDQLALLARRGEQVVARQSLTGGRYHLIEHDTIEPYPDYWNSVLWKRLMGPRVLAASLRPSPPPESPGAGLLRVYAHCAAGARAGTGAVTVLAINLDPTRTASLELEGMGAAREVYLLTGPDLLGTEVRLNDVRLSVADDGSPPPLEPVATRGPVELPARSYAFIVLPEARAGACR